MLPPTTRTITSQERAPHLRECALRAGSVVVHHPQLPVVDTEAPRGSRRTGRRGCRQRRRGGGREAVQGNPVRRNAVAPPQLPGNAPVAGGLRQPPLPHLRLTRGAAPAASAHVSEARGRVTARHQSTKCSKAASYMEAAGHAWPDAPKHNGPRGGGLQSSGAHALRRQHVPLPPAHAPQRQRH